MRVVYHRRYGDAASVLEVGERPDPEHVPDGSVVVKVRYAAVHRADLPAIERPAALPTGPEPIQAMGRVPGVEGVGVIESVGPSASDLSVGTRVAFYPVPGTWSDKVVVPIDLLVPLPDDVDDTGAAAMLVGVITAASALRTAGAQMAGSFALQTAGNSLVGRLITVMLLRAGVTPIRLVRSRATAAALDLRLPNAPVVVTDEDGWQERVRAHLGRSDAPLAFDGVGGDTLGQVATLVAEGGSIVSYGMLGGPYADIRPILPRALTLRGVTISGWRGGSPDRRADDVGTAVRLLSERPELFAPSAVFPPEEVQPAVKAATRSRKSGPILLDFGR